MTTTPIDHKARRSSDVDKIKDSPHPKKVVVAGPGTGKSYLFSEIIKKKRAEGKTRVLAITFIGKLGDALADDLCGLATTTTMHGFARGLVLQYCKDWVYYPKVHELIREDLKAEGVEQYEIGDENYVKKTKYYCAVGDADVVHYAIEICRKDPRKIPTFDLVLVDEYQDFNALESEFIDLLAQKNEIVIVGDDDQALYAFKGSSPEFIRAKYDPANDEFESHTLRYCSRCTEVTIGYFHTLVSAFNLNDPAKGRVQKEYICYSPDKMADSRANPKIHLIKQCPVGMIAHKIQSELESFVEGQKLKDILVIGEGRSCEALLMSVAEQLRNYGFANVDYRGGTEILPMKQRIVDAYKFLSKDNNSRLAWRILESPTDDKERGKHLKNSNIFKKLITVSPAQRDAIKQSDIIALEEALEDWEPKKKTNSKEGEVPDMGIRENQNEAMRKRLLVQQLKERSTHIPRPLCNIDITVCNILNSKGLGADIVFLLGFDQGRFPSKAAPIDGEIYQMLVAITRAKKKVYLINTISKQVSGFIDCLAVAHLEIEEIQIK